MKKLKLLTLLLFMASVTFGQVKYETGETHSAPMKITYGKHFKVHDGFAYSLNPVGPYEFELFVQDLNTLEIVKKDRKNDLTVIDFIELEDVLYLIHVNGVSKPDKISCTPINKDGYGKTKLLYTSEIALSSYANRTYKTVYVGNSPDNKNAFISVLLNKSVGGIPFTSSRFKLGEVETILYNEDFEEVGSTKIDDHMFHGFADSKIDNNGDIFITADFREEKASRIDQCKLIKLSVKENKWETVSIKKVSGSNPQIIIEGDNVFVFGYSYYLTKRNIPIYNGVYKYQFDKDLEEINKTKFKISSSIYSKFEKKELGIFNLALMYVFKSGPDNYIIIGEKNSYMQFSGIKGTGANRGFPIENDGIVISSLKGEELGWDKCITKQQEIAMYLDNKNTDAGIFANLIGTNVFLYYMDHIKNRDKKLDEEHIEKSKTGGDLVQIKIPIESGEISKTILLNTNNLSKEERYIELRKWGPINIAQSYMDENGTLYMELRDFKKSTLFKFN